jgi:DNA-binding SARP family transcriptional activator
MNQQMAPSAWVGLLGPVEIRISGLPVIIPQLAKRVILAALALSADRVVGARDLIETLWQEDVSKRRIGNLQSHVSQLRRILCQAGGDAAVRIRTQPPGYRLTLLGATRDIDEMERLVHGARAAMSTSAIEEAATKYRVALELWRGPTLGDVAEVSPRLRCIATQLDERRLAVLEERVTADMALGLHGDLVSELTGLVSHYPFREKSRCQLMVCLYRNGRRADALTCYHDARKLFAEELGLDPGAELDALYQRILRADPSLDLRGTSARTDHHDAQLMRG